MRRYVFRHDRRRTYVQAATRASSARASARPAYDLVLIGAGVHAAAFLTALRQAGTALKVLVVERSGDVCATFARLGDAMVLNPYVLEGGPNANIVPGHFLQLSDFDELAERRSPPPSTCTS